MTSEERIVRAHTIQCLVHDRIRLLPIQLTYYTLQYCPLPYHGHCIELPLHDLCIKCNVCNVSQVYIAQPLHMASYLHYAILCIQVVVLQRVVVAIVNTAVVHGVFHVVVVFFAALIP